MGRFNKQFKAEMTKNLHEVVRAWLMAATGRVPVWSGMAMGSLLEVSETVNGGLIVTAKQGIPNRVAAGRALGDAIATYGPNEYAMIIKSSVPHYVTQDAAFVGVSKSAPWQSFPAGLAAAEKAKSNIKVSGPELKLRKVAI